MIDARNALARRLQFAIVGATFALIALIFAWLLHETASITKALLAILVTLPLWFSLPWLSKGNRRACAWMTLGVIPYMVIAVTDAIADPQARVWSGACLFTSFALFVLLIGYLRVAQAHDA